MGIIQIDVERNDMILKNQMKFFTRENQNEDNMFLSCNVAQENQ